MTPIDPSRTLFVGIGKSVPCWYRCALPAMHIGAEWCGVRGNPPELHFVTGLTPRALDLEGLFDYEAIVVQQAQGGWKRIIPQLRAAGVTVLYEIDDYVHGVRKSAGHAFRGVYTKTVLKDIETTMALCDGLIVSTDFLAQRYRAFNPTVFVCRNGLDLGRYQLTRVPSDSRVTIGWAGGTGHHEAVLPWLPAVQRVMEQREHVRFVTVGEPFAEPLIARFGPERALALPWTDFGSYPSAMANFDIAIAPAGRSNYFRAKSDLRWLEAGALGLPVVADPFVYDEIEPGVTGLYAETAEEAERHLLALVDDREARERIGAAARAHVREHRSSAAMAGQWIQVLAEAGERREEAMAA
jgi:glycosyltransferase involved in cell wall biosynthesis